MTPKEELIQTIERSPDEVVYMLLEIVRILQRQFILTEMRPMHELGAQVVQPIAQSTEKSQGLAAHLIGIAKTDAPVPTDDEVNAMLDERVVQKYL